MDTPPEQYPPKIISASPNNDMLSIEAYRQALAELNPDPRDYCLQMAKFLTGKLHPDSAVDLNMGLIKEFAKKGNFAEALEVAERLRSTTQGTNSYIQGLAAGAKTGESRMLTNQCFDEIHQAFPNADSKTSVPVELGEALLYYLISYGKANHPEVIEQAQEYIGYNSSDDIKVRLLYKLGEVVDNPEYKLEANKIIAANSDKRDAPPLSYGKFHNPSDRDRIRLDLAKDGNNEIVSAVQSELEHELQNTLNAYLATDELTSDGEKMTKQFNAAVRYLDALLPVIEKFLPSKDWAEAMIKTAINQLEPGSSKRIGLELDLKDWSSRSPQLHQITHSDLKVADERASLLDQEPTDSSDSNRKLTDAAQLYLHLAQT